MEIIERIALERLGFIVSPKGNVTPEIATALIAELAHVGVKISNPEDVSDNLKTSYKNIIKHVRKMRGEKGTYTPLFAGFPEKLPTFDNAKLRFTLAAARLGEDQSDEALREALDFSAIGWWPASSVNQDVDATLLARSAQEILPGDNSVQWMKVKVVSPAEAEAALKVYVQDCFASKASLRADVRLDVMELVKIYGTSYIDVETVKFRETRTMLLKLIWEKTPELLTSTGATPTDLLRVFADVTGGDVSLSAKISYPKFSRKERRSVVMTLENSGRLEEIFKRRDLWLALDKGLHIGEFKAPKTQEAFQRLRSTRHDASSLLSRFETLLPSDHVAAVNLLAEEAPGVLARNLRRVMALAKTSNEEANIISTLKEAGGKVPLRVLLAAQSQVADNGVTYPRVAFTKLGQPLMLDNKVGHLSVSSASQKDVLSALDATICSLVAEKGSWETEKVFIDPKLGSILLPDQLRATAPGLVQVERGSRLPLGSGKVVRMFVHWKDSGDYTDLDLSMLALDANFNIVSQVSWTNLADGAMAHSGDITSAPVGAEEFIDVDLATAKLRGKEKGWRYLVPAIFRYSGSTFSALEEANVGWMLRDEVNSSHKVFDPATVVNAFELSGSQRSALPMLLDLETDEVLYVDVYLGGHPGTSVETAGTSVTTLVKAVSERKKLKVSVEDLALYHVESRGGALVKDPLEATVSFGLDDECTYNALRPEKILAELL